MAEYVGRTVWKSFPGHKEPFKGTITEYDEAAQFWLVKYDDGDQEELSDDELQAVLVDPAEAGPSGEGAQTKNRGRKKLLQPQRKRRATAQALAPAEGPSSEAVKGKRALRSPASTAAAERLAKKQKQDGKKQRLDGGEKAAPPGSPAATATQRKQQAKEMKLASPKKASGGSGGAKAHTIRRGAPTSGPLEGPTRFHNHVVYNGVAYIAGQTAKDHSVQDYAAQTKQVLEALDEQLEAAGSSRNNLLKANVLLKDIALGAETFNAIWEKWIDPKHAPARMTFEASLIHPDLLVEVDAIAAVPGDQT
ncbi:probable rutC family protein YoaB at C-terminar half [Coccomyxa sp. Obi]|nr:probable rutC family protein YoaB at C-terminar half [Coccomyxa sp. Obi]